jgi:U6 snRNA-associated Sm-like protein LSm7
MDKKICVKFTGGREVTGTLKGYDALMNLVLDDVDEVVRGLSSIPTAREKGER